MLPPTWAIRTEADKAAIEQGAYWDQEAGDRIIRFANAVFRPQYLTGKFELLEWQERFLRSLYSWRNRDGTRRFKVANLHIAKKNGKTLLVSLISAYELVAAGIPSPFVVTGSTGKDNASQVFAELRNTLTQAGLSRFCRITPNIKRVQIPSLNAEYRSLASDGDRVQGYNCSLVVLDEAHAHKSSSLYDSLKYATIARPNGLLIVISTAGDDASHWYYGLYEKSKRILAGDDLDTEHYAEVYESDPEKPADDITQWYLANPSMGVSFSEEDFGKRYLSAKNDTNKSEWWRWLRYCLNRWTKSEELQYYDPGEWMGCKWDEDRDGPEPDLTNCDCWLGVDLSLSVDPSSVTAVWSLGDRRHYVQSWSWVCKDGVIRREKTNKRRYQDFENQGCMTRTEGDRSDHELILSHILDLCGKYRVRSVVFDPTAAIAMASSLEAEGYPVLTMYQSHKNYNGPMRELNKAINERRMYHDGNEWLKYNMGCLRVHETRDGLIRPFTKKSTDHIDGVIALLMAYSAALQTPESSGPGVVFV